MDKDFIENQSVEQYLIKNLQSLRPKIKKIKKELSKPDALLKV
jgi:hypothetical protein